MEFIGKEPFPKISLDECNKKWKETFWEQRQYILATQTSVGRTIGLLKYKHEEFSKIPRKIQEEIARYWGFSLE